MKKFFVLVALFIVFVLLLYGCGSSSSGGGSDSVFVPASPQIVKVETKEASPVSDTVVSCNIENVSGQQSVTTVNLFIPNGAISSTTDISIGYVDNPPVNENSDSNGLYIDFSPDGLTFTNKVSVTINYDESDFPLGYDESKLKLYTYNSSLFKWEAVPSQTLYVSFNYIVAELEHFSFYNIAVKKYDLSTSVRPLSSGSVSPANGTYIEGSTFNITATALSSYVFDHWEGDLIGTSNPIVVTMNNDVNITAVYTYAGGTYPLSIIVTPNSYGSVSVSPAGGFYLPGTQVNLTAVASANRFFDRWETSTLIFDSTNPVTITMDEPKIITANFLAGKSLFTSVSPNSTGVVSPDSGVFPCGSGITMEAIPTTGYIFNKWLGDVHASHVKYNPVFSDSGDSDVYATAEFVRPSILSVTVTPNNSGSVALFPSGGEYTPDTEVDLTPQVEVGWIFDHWEGDLTGSADPYNDLLMNVSKNVTAVFVPQTFTLSVNVSGNGVVSVNPYMLNYPANTVVTLSVLADSGYTFVNWNNDNNDLNPTKAITMDNNKSISVEFNAVWTDLVSPYSLGSASNVILKTDGSGDLYAFFSVSGEGFYLKKFNGTSWDNIGSGVAVTFSNTVCDLQFHVDIPYIAYEDKNDSDKIAIIKYNGSAWESAAVSNCPISDTEYFSMDIYDSSGSAVPYVAFSVDHNTFVYTVSNNVWEYVNDSALQITYSRSTPVIKTIAKNLGEHGVIPQLVLSYAAYSDGYINTLYYNDYPGNTAGWRYSNSYDSGYVWNSGFNYDLNSSDVGYYLWSGDLQYICVYKAGTGRIDDSLADIKLAGTSLCMNGDTPIIAYLDGKSEYYGIRPVRVIKYDGTQWNHSSSPQATNGFKSGLSVVAVSSRVYMAHTDALGNIVIKYFDL